MRTGRRESVATECGVPPRDGRDIKSRVKVGNLWVRLPVSERAEHRPVSVGEMKDGVNGINLSGADRDLGMGAPGEEVEGLLSWYALRTRSRQEKMTSKFLKRTGIEVFLPTISRVRQWKDRKMRILFPLFPGYCFVRCDVMRFRQVRMAPGAVELMGSAGMPVPIPQEQIDAVQRLVYCTLPYDPHPTLEPGMKVRVVRGPLFDVEGVLIRKSPRAKILISIHLLHQGATVTLDAEDVVAV